MHLTRRLFLWSTLTLAITSPALAHAQQHTITVGGDEFTCDEQARHSFFRTTLTADRAQAHVSATVSLASRDGMSWLYYRLESSNRESIEGDYKYVDGEIVGHYTQGHGSPEFSIIDGEVRMVLHDATLFPPEYDVYLDLYLLPEDKASSWNEHRKFHARSHPDDAIPVHARFTYRPPMSCIAGEEVYHWVDDYGTGEVDIRTQFPQGVTPTCRRMAGVRSMP